MLSLNDVIERLKSITKTKTNTALADALKVNESTIRSWKNRGTIPYEQCLKVSETYDCTMDWLLKGVQNETPPNVNGQLVTIPFYDVEASAGHGALVESDQYEKLITFSPDYIRNEIGVNPNNVFLMLARGDSMYPTIKDGAMIMVEKDLEHLNDGIFVLRLNNALLVKRLNILPTGTIKVLSDNKMYEPYEIDAKLLEADNVEVLGRVVWSGQRM
jgi:phage repressor protein C with HTH and peptisase S24 domain